MEEVTSPRRVAHLHASGCHGPAELGGSEPAAANLDDLAERARSEDRFHFEILLETRGPQLNNSIRAELF